MYMYSDDSFYFYYLVDIVYLDDNYAVIQILVERPINIMLRTEYWVLQHVISKYA